jgi:protoporphyrinogen/coproporphyrinogen III oxidase
MASLQGKRVAVIGAGVSGLSAAYRLQQRGAQVSVFEQHNYLGGRTRSVRQGEFVFDVGAYILLPTYKNVAALIRELGIEGEVHNAKPRLAIVRNGRRHSFDYARPFSSFFKFKLLSWWSKLKLLRLLPDLIRHRKRFNYQSMGDLGPLDAESTQAYCLRVLNAEVDTYLANPFVRINALTNTHQVPVGEWLWQLSAFQSPHLFQLNPGMVFLAESLARGLDVQLGARVQRVFSEGGGAVVQIEDVKTRYDACLLAVPPAAAHAICQSVTPQQETFFGQAQSVAMTSLHLGLRTCPDIAEALILIPEVESPDLSLIVLEHNKGPGRAPQGKAVVNIQTSREWSQRHALDSDAAVETEIIKLVEPYLGKLDGLVETSFVNRWEHVCTVTHPGYFGLLAAYMKSRNLNQPLFFSGDFTASGIEGAVTSGLNAAEHIETFLKA